MSNWTQVSIAKIRDHNHNNKCGHIAKLKKQENKAAVKYQKRSLGHFGL